MKTTTGKKELVYMTDEQLVAAGFGFLIKPEKVTPVINEVFIAKWSERFFHSTDSVSGVNYYGNKPKSVTGKIDYLGKNLAIIICEKTDLEVCVDLKKVVWSKNEPK